MKARTLLMFAFAFFTVTLNTACPRDIANKVAEQNELRKEYNDKVKEHNDLGEELTAKYGLSFIFASISFSNTAWGGKTKAELDAAEQKIQRYLELCGRLIELAQHENVKDLVKDGELEKFRSNRRLASEWQQSLKNYRKDKGV